MLDRLAQLVQVVGVDVIDVWRLKIRHVPLLSVPRGPIRGVVLVPLENGVDELDLGSAFLWHLMG